MIWPPVRWRRLNRWYAHTFRYFWLPCPICGESFGGHEALPGHSLFIKGSKWSSVCYKEPCYLEALNRNKETGWSRYMAQRDA